MGELCSWIGGPVSTSGSGGGSSGQPDAQPEIPEEKILYFYPCFDFSQDGIWLYEDDSNTFFNDAQFYTAYYAAEMTKGTVSTGEHLCTIYYYFLVEFENYYNNPNAFSYQLSNLGTKIWLDCE
ncbi:MAG: hypothetical protein LUC37_06815 [Prevotella sp.]|nr:hypothetical protein [Prevotella sp.]